MFAVLLLVQRLFGLVCVVHCKHRCRQSAKALQLLQVRCHGRRWEVIPHHGKSWRQWLRVRTLAGEPPAIAEIYECSSPKCWDLCGFITFEWLLVHPQINFTIFTSSNGCCLLLPDFQVLHLILVCFTLLLQLLQDLRCVTASLLELVKPRMKIMCIIGQTLIQIRTCGIIWHHLARGCPNCTWFSI